MLRGGADGPEADVASPPLTPGQLDLYWPIDTPQRGWLWVDHATMQHGRTVTNTNVNALEFRLWFFNKQGQPAGQYDIEHCRYCNNPGGDPWLWLERNINYDGSRPASAPNRQP